MNIVDTFLPLWPWTRRGEIPFPGNSIASSGLWPCGGQDSQKQHSFYLGVHMVLFGCCGGGEASAVVRLKSEVERFWSIFSDFF